jgi:RHS repeat-associated protein
VSLLLAVETAMVVESTGQAIAIAPETSATASVPASAKAYGPAEAQDEASARLMARLQHRRIEVLGERTDASQTFVNADGTLTFTTSVEPQRVKRGDDWAALDAGLQATASGDYAPAVSESGLVLSGGGSGPLATMTVDGKWLSLSWPTALPKPTVSGDTATYPDVLASGVDLRVTATAAGGVEETLVVKNAEAAADPALASLTLATSTSAGATLSADAGGNLAVSDSHGRRLITSPAPVMWDSSTTDVGTTGPQSLATSPTATSPAAGPQASSSRAASARQAGSASVKATKSTASGPGLRAHRAKVKVNLKSHRLTLTPDHGMLTGKDTVFPVFIDPAFVPHPASGSTLHYDEVQQAYPTVSNYGAAPGSGLGVGYQGFSSPTGIERTYYNLSVPSAIWGGTVFSASLNTKVVYAAASGSNSTTVNAYSTCAITASTTWNAQPCHDSAANPNYPNPNVSKTFTTTSSSPNLAVAFDVTAGMQKIADIHNTNWTMGLYNATETNDVDLVRFSSNPTFSITYNHTSTPSTLVSPASGAATADSTPALTAKATDADGDQVSLDIEIWASNGSAWLQAAAQPYVPSGTAVTWSVPSALADGSYKWRSRSTDGNLHSAFSAFNNLTVDTRAPATTAVSSTAFPAGAWSGTPDASGNFSGSFTFTPPASDVASVEYQLDGGAWTAAATTGTAVNKTLTFRAGKRTLVARTKDAAGNTSGTTTYVFYAGSGAALNAPGAGERPARRTGLVSQGKTTDTGVTYQYRRGETDSWHDVPAGDVTKNSNGSTLSSWPVAVTGGLPAPLTWNITNTLPEDGPVDVRAEFTDGTAIDDSPANTITVDRNAGTAPSVNAGPASVNSLTGDATLSATDASAFDMSVSRTFSSRRPTAAAQATGQAAIFGPGWTSGTTAEVSDSDWSYIRSTSPTSVALVDVDGNETGFTVKSPSVGTWTAEPGAEDLTLTGKTSDTTLVLKDTEGTTTTFAKPSGASTWQVSTTKLATDNSTTTVVPDAVQTGGKVRPKYVIAPTSATDAATCQATPATKGCRMLEYLYATSTTATSGAFGDYAGQVKQIKLWATTPGDGASTASVIAQYAYDTAGNLREASDPRSGLKTSYTYDADGRVATETDPGQLPWTFTYDKVGSTAVAGDGMLLSASRPTLQQGSNTQTDGGTATTNVVYNVALTGTGAPNAMGISDVAAWGQSDAPSDATAVIPPAAPGEQTPGSHDGTQLNASDYQRATVTYINASGREVNTATPGGHITTTAYDQFGNTVQELTAANRELAQGTTPAQQAQQDLLHILDDTPADRAQALSTTSVYSTDGQRKLEESGPIHQVTLAGTLTAAPGGTDLPAGTVIPAREHTVNTYDEGRPTDGTATVANQLTTSTVGADVDKYPTDGDVRTTTTAYDWVKGVPTKTVTDPNGLKLTKTTGYDTQGRVIYTSLPKSTGTDAGTTITTYWSATGTGACNGHPEWADLVCSTGPASAITGGGTNPSQLVTSTTTYDRWGNPATVTDAANGSTRTTTTTYDGAGRPTKVTVTGGTGTAVPDTSTTYDPATGQKATVTSGGQTVSYTYDVLGRQTQYTDGATTTTTAYDALDRPVTVTNNAPSTTTYTYDRAKDPRGLLTSMTDSVAGTISADYDSNGAMQAEHLPGGISLAVTRDQADAVTGRTYTRDSDQVQIAADTGSDTIQGQQATHDSTTGTGADQAYTYDQAGRLTKVDDTQSGTTTHRAYAFDNNTNRTGLTTTVDNTDGSAGTPVTTAYTYDSADRLQTLNGTGVGYDAFGRTTTQADGTTLAYYANDLARQETAGTSRQTWTLDATGRLAAWTTETNNAGTWTQTGSKTNHYGGDSDSPDWTTEDTGGTITRDVQGIDGDLAATTDATGNTILQLTNMHGDAVVTYPLDTTKNPTVQAADEYGNPINGTTTSRYGWLGAKQRSTETPSGLTLMGIRLYNPTTGHFLSTDPIPGGNANAYEYCTGDPINCYDLDGRWGWHLFSKRHLHFVIRDGRRGFHWRNHSHRIEWDKHHKWHYNRDMRRYGGQNHHLHWARGVRSFFGHAVDWAARANPVFWVPIFLPREVTHPYRGCRRAELCGA